MKKFSCACLSLAVILGISGAPVSAEDPAPTPVVVPCLPANATVTAATFKIYVSEVPVDAATNPVKVNLHRITYNSFWHEGDFTWNIFQNQYSPLVSASINITGTGWYSFDIKSLAQGWVNGQFSNYGFALVHDPLDPRMVVYHSSETANLPSLAITFSYGSIVGQTVTLDRNTTNVEDQYIWASSPDSYGNWGNLYTGMVGSAIKKTLFRFDFSICNGIGTFTPGYWKNHADPSKKKYDCTWDKITDSTNVGAGATFLTAKFGVITWMDALSTPAKGNAFWILSRAYAAAYLNKEKANNAALPVDGELAAAKKILEDALFLSNSNPVIAKKTLEWDVAIKVAKVLDNFNNGKLTQ